MPSNSTQDGGKDNGRHLQGLLYRLILNSYLCLNAVFRQLRWRVACRCWGSGGGPRCVCRGCGLLLHNRLAWPEWLGCGQGSAPGWRCRRGPCKVLPHRPLRRGPPLWGGIRPVGFPAGSPCRSGVARAACMPVGGCTYGAVCAVFKARLIDFCLRCFNSVNLMQIMLLLATMYS